MENPAKYCTACGKGLVETAVVCPSCGSPTAKYNQRTKKKSVAIVLAVFLSYWSWLYTAQKNLPKFFIALGISVVAGILIGVNQAALTSWASGYTECIIYNIQEGTTYDCESIYPSNPIWGILIQIGVAASIGVYIWALVDNIRRSSDYFTNFPEVSK